MKHVCVAAAMFVKFPYPTLVIMMDSINGTYSLETIKL
jgi:hypothetical protein